MSDILARAKELVTRYEASGYIHRDAMLLLPGLVAECEFWRRKAIEEHAARLYYESLPCRSDEYSWHDYPEDPCQCKKKSTYRVQAERELEAMR